MYLIYKKIIKWIVKYLLVLCSSQMAKLNCIVSFFCRKTAWVLRRQPLKEMGILTSVLWGNLIPVPASLRLGLLIFTIIPEKSNKCAYEVFYSDERLHVCFDSQSDVRKLNNRKFNLSYLVLYYSRRFNYRCTLSVA